MRIRSSLQDRRTGSRLSATTWCLVAGLALTVLATACHAAPSSGAPVSLAQQVALLSEAKAQAEQLAAFFKPEVEKDSTMPNRHFVLSYVVAQAACNGWVQGIEFAIASGAGDLSSTYNTSFNDAISKAYMFIKQARDRVGGTQPVQTPTAVSDISTVRDIINAYQRAPKETRDAVIKVLDGVKWLSWDELKKPRPDETPTGKKPGGG